MAQQFAYDGQRNSVPDRKRSEAVPQVMEPHIVQASLGAERGPYELNRQIAVCTIHARKDRPSGIGWSKPVQ